MSKFLRSYFGKRKAQPVESQAPAFISRSPKYNSEKHVISHRVASDVYVSIIAERTEVALTAKGYYTQTTSIVPIAEVELPVDAPIDDAFNAVIIQMQYFFSQSIAKFTDTSN